MQPNALQELREFHQFLAGLIEAGVADRTPEAALDEWRKRPPESDEVQIDLEAIRAALQELELDLGETGIGFGSGLYPLSSEPTSAVPREMHPVNEANPEVAALQQDSIPVPNRDQGRTVEEADAYLVRGSSFFGKSLG